MENLLTNVLRSFGSAPFEGGALAEALRGYDAVDIKLSRMVKNGELLRLKRGLYCVSPANLREGRRLLKGVIANRLYGPSYVSYETALAAYGLIPERVTVERSAVCKASRSFETPIGLFEYFETAAELMPLGVRVERTEDGNYLMANPTKALCDTLMRKRRLRVTSPKTLRDFLETDMRFDFDYFGEPDFETLSGFVDYGVKPGLFKALERMFS